MPFLKKIILPFLLCATLFGAQNPPWRMIYDNDTTGILNCISPYNPVKNRVLTEEKIRASVREAVVEGVDAQLLQPAHGWVPWWHSKVLPLKEHEQWFQKHYGAKPNLGEMDFLRKGGDLIGVFIDECKKNNVAALVSYRMNDGHHQEWAFEKKVGGVRAHTLNRFYVEHPDYRIGTLDDKTIKGRVHNWLIPEVRAYKEAFIKELIQIYGALDGMELDFMRHPYYFPDGAPMAERVQVMCGFIEKIRAALDEKSKADGRYRYLGVRVPIHEADWKDVGFEAGSWRKAGVDYFNLSPSYNMTQQTSIAAARASAPDAKIYAELTHTAQTWKFGGKGYDDHCWRRCTKEMFENTARIAYARGADGLSLFNFVYYRAHGGLQDQKGPFNEPPFAQLPGLLDKEKLADIPGYFYLWVKDELFPAGGRWGEYKMDVVPAKGNGYAVLRLWLLDDSEKTYNETQDALPIDRGQWQVSINGKDLEQFQSPPLAYPFPTEYQAGFGRHEQYLAFAVPAGTLKDGVNDILLGNQSPALRLRWIEIIQLPR